MKKWVVILMLLLLNSVVYAYEYSDYSWKTYKGHQYAITLDYSNWSQAEAWANEVGGHLVTINDDAENSWLSTTFQGYYAKCCEGNTWSSLVWIGLQLTPPNPDLSWSSGEPVTYVAYIWNGGSWSNLYSPAYLHTDTHPVPGSWWNSDSHDIDPNGYPRGIIEIVDPFCKSDSNYDGKVNLADLVTIKSEFMRSDCPSDGPAPVAKTWQTTIHANYDDGYYQQGVAYPTPRFQDNGNGTVTDKLTGLIWLKNADCFGARTWDQAISDCNGLNSGECGLTDGSISGDWRLPSVKELYSLCDLDYFDPPLPNTVGTGKWTAGDPFTDVRFLYYWSSSTCSFHNGSAFGVNMGAGYVGYILKEVPNYDSYVWPVRGGHQDNKLI